MQLQVWTKSENYWQLHYRLLEDVVSVSVGETECSALCADGTVWTWGARSGVSLEEHQDDPYYPPTQVLDQVVQLFGDLAVKEDGTLVRVWFDGDTCTAAPLMEHVAAVGSLYCGIQDPAMLVQGQDGSLWRVPWENNLSDTVQWQSLGHARSGHALRGRGGPARPGCPHPGRAHHRSRGAGRRGSLQ